MKKFRVRIKETTVRWRVFTTEAPTKFDAKNSGLCSIANGDYKKLKTSATRVTATVDFVEKV